MSLSSETTRLSVTLTAAAQEVPVTFYFVQTSDLQVVTSAGVVLVEGVDYTVAGAGNSAGGSITTIPTAGNGLGIGSQLAIIRNGPLDQQTSLPNNGEFPSTTIERTFDKVVTLIQQVAEIASRAIRLPTYEAGSSSMELPLAATRANKFVGFDSAGAMVMKDASTVDGSLTAQSDVDDSFSVTKAGTGNSASVIFDSTDAPKLVLSEGKWLVMGSVTARTSNGNDTIWAKLRNVEDNLTFGGGASCWQLQVRTNLTAQGYLNVAAGTTRTIYFHVFCEDFTLDVGASPDGPSGYLIAQRVPSDA